MHYPPVPDGNQRNAQVQRQSCFHMGLNPNKRESIHGTEVVTFIIYRSLLLTT